MLHSPLRWVGGKSRLRAHIIPLFPDHDTYCEPFGGGGWVLLGKKPAATEIYNDLDADLVAFFRVVQRDPQALIDSFQWTLVSREEFTRLAALDPATLSDVDRAHRLYYLLMAGWGGELKYPRFQTAVQDAGHGNRLIGALRTLDQRLRPVHARLRTVTIEHGSWERVIDLYDSPGTFFYIDPPYPDNGVNYAHNMPDLADHRRLAARLARAQGQWMISSYDRPELRALYGGLHVESIQSASGMATGDKTGRVTNREMVVCNFIPPCRAAQPSLFA
ncbi:DNA adenine methylase [Deinococcus soli (ex Cha et al. 2016)]|uniref:DNA adenine methylase n=1 Tax=Deinococcus soli (ex Cha et al. 2016) TaxID=1309411 RepID=UPI00286D083F|nr:DNA adenine methylase [Deinococcus soli (ex Cha et al. 2016)]